MKRSIWILLTLAACSGSVLYSGDYLEAHRKKADAPDQSMVFTFAPDASLSADDAFAYLFPGKTVDAFQSGDAGNQFVADMTMETVKVIEETQEIYVNLTLILTVKNSKNVVVRQGFKSEGLVVVKFNGTEDVMQGTLRDENGQGKVIDIYATRLAQPNVKTEDESWTNSHPWANGSLKVDPNGAILGQLQGYAH